MQLDPLTASVANKVVFNCKISLQRSVANKRKCKYKGKSVNKTIK